MNIMTKKTIVVADDLPNVTAALKRMLDPYYEVIEVYSGSEVRDVCQEQPINGVIIDMRFDNGGMSGIDTVKLLRKDYPTLKIILFSAQEYNTEERARVSEAGAEFLPKPVDVASVRKILG
jgi:DNA-binding NtrC family response regulator